MSLTPAAVSAALGCMPHGQWALLDADMLALCRCDVCDESQDDGRKTVSEPSVQRITSKETAQT